MLKSLECALSSRRFIQLQISRWWQVETLHRTVSCRSELHPPRRAFRWSHTPSVGEARCDLVESDERKAELCGELTVYRRRDSCAGIQGVGYSKGWWTRSWQFQASSHQQEFAAFCLYARGWSECVTARRERAEKASKWITGRAECYQRRLNVFFEMSSKFFAVHFTFRRGGGWGKGRRKYRGGRSAGEGGVGVFRRNADRLYWSTPPEVLHTNTEEAGAAVHWSNQTAANGIEWWIDPFNRHIFMLAYKATSGFSNHLILRFDGRVQTPITPRWLSSRIHTPHAQDDILLSSQFC